VKGWWVPALLIAAATQGLRAQTVVTPPRQLDSTQARLRDALYLLRDSLLPVRAASVRMPLDQPSGAVLRSRSRVLADRCDRAHRFLPSVQVQVKSYSPPTKPAGTGRDRLLATLRRLDDNLVSCTTTFSDLVRPEQAAQLRDFGAERSRGVAGAVDDYETTLRDAFPMVFGIRYMPQTKGAGHVPGRAPGT
jgi:hypothetical protein